MVQVRKASPMFRSHLANIQAVDVMNLLMMVASWIQAMQMDDQRWKGYYLPSSQGLPFIQANAGKSPHPDLHSQERGQDTAGIKRKGDEGAHRCKSPV